MDSEWSQNTDLLVPLAGIDFNPPLFEELAAQGIAIKRAAPMDSSQILSFVQTEFSQNWHDEVAFCLHNRDCWIAVDSGRIVGFIVINAQAPDFVGPLGVTESHRGRGLAVALTIRAFEGLYHQGYRYAICGWVSYSTYRFVEKHIAAPVVLPGAALSSFGNAINAPSAPEAPPETAAPAASNPCALRLAYSNPNHVSGVWRYRQTDPRYAAERVGALTFAQAGCGPCAIANIVDRNPAEILAWLNENGYVTSTNGIFWKGIPAALDHFGGNGQLLCDRRLSNEPDHPCFAQLKDHLRAGLPGIILMGPGNWTRSAHFVSAVGFCDEQDAVLLYDPKGEEFDGWYPWSSVIAQAQTCLMATTPPEDKYAPRYIFKQAFGTKIAGHEQYWPAIEHDVLARINPNYVGWIHLDHSPINYPIVKQRFQTDYYLARNFSEEDSCHGCVTLDFRHGGSFDCPNVLLEAHDMRDGSMFAAMLRYDEPAWSNEHPVIELQLPGASYHATVFSAYPFNKKPLSDKEARSPRARARKMRFDSAEDLENWAQERVALSSHPFDVLPKRGDTFITFSTCNKMFGYDSFVAHAILKPVEKAQ